MSFLGWRNRTTLTKALSLQEYCQLLRQGDSRDDCLQCDRFVSRFSLTDIIEP